MPFFAIFFAFIVWLGYTLLPEKPAVTSAPAVTQAPSLVDEAQSWVTSQLSSQLSSTLALVELPEQGCSASLLSAEKLEELLLLLPPTQSEALGKLLNASSDVWQASLYQGELGAGLCLPSKNTLVVLPQLNNLPTLEQLGLAAPASSF